MCNPAKYEGPVIFGQNFVIFAHMNIHDYTVEGLGMIYNIYASMPV